MALEFNLESGQWECALCNRHNNPNIPCDCEPNGADEMTENEETREKVLKNLSDLGANAALIARFRAFSDHELHDLTFWVVDYGQRCLGAMGKRRK